MRKEVGVFFLQVQERTHVPHFFPLWERDDVHFLSRDRKRTKRTRTRGRDFDFPSPY